MQVGRGAQAGVRAQGWRRAEADGLGCRDKAGGDSALCQPSHDKRGKENKHPILPASLHQKGKENKKEKKKEKGKKERAWGGGKHVLPLSGYVLDVPKSEASEQGKRVAEGKCPIEFSSQHLLEQTPLLMACLAQPVKPSRKTAKY